MITPQVLVHHHGKLVVDLRRSGRTLTMRVLEQGEGLRHVDGQPVVVIASCDEFELRSHLCAAVHPRTLFLRGHEKEHDAATDEYSFDTESAAISAESAFRAMIAAVNGGVVDPVFPDDRRKQIETATNEEETSVSVGGLATKLGMICGHVGYDPSGKFSTVCQRHVGHTGKHAGMGAEWNDAANGGKGEVKAGSAYEPAERAGVLRSALEASGRYGPIDAVDPHNGSVELSAELTLAAELQLAFSAGAASRQSDVDAVMSDYQDAAAKMHEALTRAEMAEAGRDAALAFVRDGMTMVVRVGWEEGETAEEWRDRARNFVDSFDPEWIKTGLMSFEDRIAKERATAAENKALREAVEKAETQHPYWAHRAMAEHIEKPESRCSGRCREGGLCITEWCAACYAKWWMDHARAAGSAPSMDPSALALRTLGGEGGGEK